MKVRLDTDKKVLLIVFENLNEVIECASTILEGAKKHGAKMPYVFGRRLDPTAINEYELNVEAKKFLDEIAPPPPPTPVENKGPTITIK